MPRTRSPGLRAAARASALSDPRFSVSNVEPIRPDDAKLHLLGRRPAPSPQPMGRTRTSHRMNPRVTSTIGCGRILTVGVRPSTYGGRARPAVPARLKRPGVYGLRSMARRLLYPERYSWAGSGGGREALKGESLERRCYRCFRTYPKRAPVCGLKGCAPDTGPMFSDLPFGSLETVQ